jgi:hypothetical protein
MAPNRDARNGESEDVMADRETRALPREEVDWGLLAADPEVG